MATRVYKYPLHIEDCKVMPLKGKIVHIDLSFESRDVLSIWAEATDGATGWERTLQVFGTGSATPLGAEHVATVIDREHRYVWHVYDVTDCQ